MISVRTGITVPFIFSLILNVFNFAHIGTKEGGEGTGTLPCCSQRRLAARREGKKPEVGAPQTCKNSNLQGWSSVSTGQFTHCSVSDPRLF